MLRAKRKSQMYSFPGDTELLANSTGDRMAYVPAHFRAQQLSPAHATFPLC